LRLARQDKIQDSSLADLKAVGIQYACGTPNLIIKDDFGESCAEQAKDCLACPVTCGMEKQCKEEIMANHSSGNYGVSRILESHITTARHERVVGMEGPSAVLVSPDNVHVYVASYTNGEIACFTRNASTGLLTFNPAGGLLKTDATAAAEGDLDRVPQCQNSGDECDGTGYLYHGLRKMVITSNGQFIYAVSFESGALHLLRRNSATGELTRLGASLVDGGFDDAGTEIDGLAGANDVFLSADERSLFVAGYLDQSVSYFTRSDEIRQGGLLFVDRIKNGERYLHYPPS
jgi:hypothetical protein